MRHRFTSVTRWILALGYTEPRFRIGSDAAGRAVHLREMSIRNVLDRIDPLCTLSGDGVVSAPADAVAAAIADPGTPIHRRQDNRLAGAPLADYFALRRLRRIARDLARRDGATLEIAVPPPIAGWIRLRYERADRLMAQLSAYA